MVLTLTALMGAMLLFSPAANADSGHQRYARGNAPAAIDITGLRARNAEDRLDVAITVPGLTTDGRFVLNWFDPPGLDGMAVTVTDRGHHLAYRLQHCGEDSCTTVHCQGLRVRWSIRDHVISVSSPQSCYHPYVVPKSWRFAAYSTGGDGDEGGPDLKLARG